jgi:type II secretory pathway component PulF
MMDEVGSRTSTSAAVAGVALGIFGLLTAFWIPTLAAMFAVGALVSGFMQVRGASGSRRSLARWAIALGIGTILLIVVIVLLSSDASNGNAVSSIPPP